MHMADALVSPAVGGALYAVSAGVGAYSIYKLKHDEELKAKIPTMGVMGALVFAVQMMNFTIPGTGSSGHLCGGILLSALLGPYASFITMIGVLLIQCLFFADGGLLALGANIFNMSYFGCFLGGVLWQLIMKKGFSKRKIALYTIGGAILTLELGAFCVTIETLLSNITELPFRSFLFLMMPIHLAIGLGEGLITFAILTFIYETRAEMLYCSRDIEKKNRMSKKKVLAITGVMIVVIAGGLSLFASSHPDGLEWSIEKMTGNTELEENEQKIYKSNQKIQNKTAIFEDYNLKGADSDAGAAFSGVAGCAIVVICMIAVGNVVKLLKKKNQN